MLSIWNRSVVSILLTAMVLLLAFPFFANAETCQCWCNHPDGAISAGTSDKSGDFAGDCKDQCKAKNPDSTYQNCFTAAEEKLAPDENQLCWTQSECENNTIVLSDKKEVKGEWGKEQAPVCIKNKSYCYSPLDPIALSVALGEFKEAGDIGSYVSAAYKYLISAAAIIAVVMIMIGGLQYVLALGNQTKLSKAKERIQNAVIGLALVLSAYTIAYLIDPNLVSFDALRVPLIRTVVFIDPNSTCEALEDAGIDVTPGGFSMECGDKGTITSVENIKEDASVNLEVGDECLYSKCAEPGKVCVGNAAAENGAACQSCYDSSTGSSTGVAPSNSTCQQIESLLQARIDLDKPNNEIVASCEYADAVDGIYPGVVSDLIGLNHCIEFAYPNGEVGLNCELMRQNAKVQDKGCKVYEDVRLIDKVANVGLFAVFSDGWVTGFDKKICEDDPCGISANGCVYDDEYFNECLNPE